MHNDLLEKKIESKKSELEGLEKLKEFAEDKERVFAEFGDTIPRPLSEYSTTELKAELRRRKNERRR